jgi:hypothetical protein
MVNGSPLRIIGRVPTSRVSMKRGRIILSYLGVLAAGYFLGVSQPGFGVNANAQDAPASSSKPNPKLAAAIQSLSEAADALKTDGLYEPITTGTNAFLVLSGGGNAKADLESGNGVDPETYGALYAGLALPELQDQITRGDDGRLMFNGQVIQMYSKNKLQRVYASRLKLAGTR